MTAADRFWAKVSPEPNTGCWLWTGACRGFGHGLGHGRFRVAGRGSRVMYAHRYAWETCRGPVPDGLWVLHRCDVPQCVNPDHLFLGTHHDNMADMVSKGRQARGEGNGQAKLTRANVKEARRIYRRGSVEFGSVALARRFGVGHLVILRAVSGRGWVE